ncbi:MAG: ribosome biogenesis GTP-binding protein YihA/YsxC [Clostridiales bacterium]|jgi:ribosome biogenesis GTP-binding protein ysxC|nr:ribosome biogenesis GTP-binding protein YihA/YsxC [Clostridiales bacterium]PWM20585.1 MAG: YihA family ribosome biogenesis GTP-binding protein [Clostridiales bacterium]
MKVKNAKFVISAVSPQQYPEGNLLEIAFAGRSNVGKSSLINALLGRKNLAYSGSRQGMTRQINYYNLDDELHFVDLPGYGYAAVSKGEKNLWAKVIEEYLNVRPQLYLVLLLLDIRHKPSKDDENMYRWILASGLAYLIVATKSDKISRQQLQHNTALIRSTLQIPPNKDIICVSAEKRTGIEALWDAIDGYITEEEEATK